MTAITLQTCHDGPAASNRGAGRSGLRAAARRTRSTLHEWQRRNRERRELAALDDRALLDIGLSRADAEFLVNKPFWRE